MSISRKRQSPDEDEIDKELSDTRKTSDGEFESSGVATTSSSKRNRRDENGAMQEEDVQGKGKSSDPLRSINKIGRPAEAGIIQKVYVENFMCHRKFTISLCRNVNFIHGQNGSGKSAILAAIQICLGAGARRTHRARNLKELVRKESANSCNGAKVQVTLLNQGEDAFQHDIYGDSITVERSISLTGGYNGYKLLDVNGKEQSRSKKDLDAMLDQLNIQVENPVAVLDQEEAKKFLTGKAEDKYAFFNKATDLERLDRSYAAVQDHLTELDETKANVECTLGPARDNVKNLKAEWDKFKQMGKLEDQLSLQRVQYAWSVYWTTFKKLQDEEENVRIVEGKLAKRKQEWEKAVELMNNDNSDEDEIKEKLRVLTEEASAAAEAKKDIENQLKNALLPIKQHERVLASLKRDIETAKGRFKSAVNTLQETRRDIARKQGSAQSIEAKRTERLNWCEEKLGEAKDARGAIAEELEFYRKKYDEFEGANEVAQTNVDKIKKQISGADRKLKDITSVSSESNNLRIFGEKCPEMARKVDEYVAGRKFRGLVLGPIGKYLKIAEGKQELASLTELAIGVGTLDRFIVTNDADRTIFMKLRADVGCGPKECSIFQMHDGPRYQVKPAPDGVETVSSVLNIAESLVYNCLVDHCNADQAALMTSKETSERALLIENNGRCSIRGGNIKQVYFLPNGDKWQVSRGGALSMISNTKRLNQTIGLDRSRAIQEAEREIDILRRELRDADDKLSSVKRDREDYKKNWNNRSSKLKANEADIKKLENEIEDLRAEAESAENATYDTSELEEDVKVADEELQALKQKESDARKAIEDLQPEAEALKRSLDETVARNAKVVSDINAIEKKLHEIARNQNEITREINKKQSKVNDAESALKMHRQIVEDSAKRNDEALSKAREVNWKYIKSSAEKKDDYDSMNHDKLPDDAKKMTMEELAAIEPMQTDHDPEFYKSKILRTEKDIQKEKMRRNFSEQDPEVAYTKYMRAKKDLDSKLLQLEQIEKNLSLLQTDLKSRRKMFKRFRSYIASQTGVYFDQILNKKGSSGDVMVDYENQTLNLTVQKDNQNAGTQTSDVKALSGGERSFTTLSLLLALGECLETPFRVMDEFDVFLDPLSRKIALETMIEVAKQMEHRQFIFITPQDLSNLQTDPRLKIIQMKPPERSQVVGGPTQSTL